jgi:hypothetical protein
MNLDRRSFLRGLGLGVAGLAAIPLARKTSYFFSPIGGWHSGLTAGPLSSPLYPGKSYSLANWPYYYWCTYDVATEDVTGKTGTLRVCRTVCNGQVYETVSLVEPQILYWSKRSDANSLIIT